MAVYMVFLRESPVRDPAAMEQYHKTSATDPSKYGMKVLAVYGQMDAIEGEPADGVVILEFPTREDALAWYNNPNYQEAAQHRRRAADYRTMLVEGFDPATFVRG